MMAKLQTFSWDFRREIKNNRSRISEELLDELFEAFEAIHDSIGIERINNLRTN